MEDVLVGLSVEFLKTIITESAKKLITDDRIHNADAFAPLVNQLCEESVAQSYSEKYISKILRFRTLHSANSDVYLDKIYTPLKITSCKTRKVSIVDDKFILNDDEIVNIVGFAGQGKSTILRKLLLEELLHGVRFPFFIELRSLSGKSVLSTLKNQLNSIGCHLTEDSAELEYFIQSKKCLIFLDGFDEIASNERQEVLNEIHDLKTRFNAEIVISSRPNTDVCRSVGFHNHEVLKLEPEDIIRILNKIDSYFKEGYTELPDIILKNKNLSNTLVSPILVNLLYAVYPHLSSIPESAIDFYQDLFSTVYSKHDKLKNFTREKKSMLNIKDSGDVFNTFCFFSLFKGQLYFNNDDFLNIIHNILQNKCFHLEDASHVMDDFINISCLIQEDGYNNYVFLHKSIQEFHAAKFLNQMPYLEKDKAYNLVSKKILKEDSLDNMVLFLKDINPDDYNSLIVCKVFENSPLNSLDEEGVRSFVLKRVSDFSAKAIFEGGIWIIKFERGFFDFISAFEFLDRGKRSYDSEPDRIISDLLNSIEDVFFQRNIHKIISNRSEKACSLKEILEINGSFENFINLSSEDILILIDRVYKPAKSSIDNYNDLYSLKI